MTREDVYKAIDAERASQDKVWRTNAPVEEQYKFSASHILLLEENAAKLRGIWYGTRDEGTLSDRLVKIAAIAVRALEEVSVTR